MAQKKPSPPATATTVEVDNTPTANKPKNHYFDNVLVERLLTAYVRGGCVDVRLRDEIMSHAAELIRQVIRTHNLHNIYPGKDQASFGDLFQTAWCQVEKSLYKFNYGPGHTKVFNMWSQVSRTVMLAHIKREGRDRKNQGAYTSHLNNKNTVEKSATFERFLNEAREICKYNAEHQKLINYLVEIYESDDRPYEGLIQKLMKTSGMPRSKIHQFLWHIRTRSFEFTDSPVNEAQLRKPVISSYMKDGEDDDE